MKRTTVLMLFSLAANWMFSQNYWSYHTLVDTNFVSQSLGYEKGITITVPNVWRHDLEQTYPVIIVFDRFNQMGHQAIIRAVDNLTSIQQMPDAIVVSIDSDQQHRYLETIHAISSKKSLLKANENFLFEELLPWIESSFHGSKVRVFVGHSRYGFFTTSLLFSHIEDITAVISLDPFFEQKKVNLTDSLAQLNDLNLSSTKYYRYANGRVFKEDYFKMEKAIETVTNPQINAKAMYLSECNHYAVPMVSITHQLQEVFSFWEKLQNDFLLDTTKTAKDFSANSGALIRHYGYPINGSYAILNGKGWDLYQKKKYTEAIQIWQLILDQFPNISDIHLNIADAQKENKISNKKSLNNFRKSIVRSTLYSEEELQELETWLEELEE